MLKIEGDIYLVWYKDNDHIIHFEGSLRLWDPGEYGRIKQYMLDIYELDTKTLSIDLTKLEFLNSSGISMLCKFVFDIKKGNQLPIIIIGKKDILWQRKSLHNLKKLWDKIELKLI
ncbi:MAG: hypothetical protein OCD02_16395 [Spirochaetaceae bacterium]